jgi:GTPase Era involved in 16S rRNA processing
MQEHHIDPRFRTEPHGNHIDINQLYSCREHLRANRYLAPTIAQQRQTLLERIDAFLNSLDDPMRVVVAGGFNAGKSTFLNALVKRHLMPVKAVRSTCTINTLKAGDCEELIVVRRNGQRDIRKYYSDEHVRAQIGVLMQNEHASIAQIEICCPNDLFLKYFTLIDTPGLDHNAEDSATSVAEVERADALIWVLHNKGAEKLDYEQILRFRAANPDSPVIVILNQIDSIEKDECDDALAAVKSKLGAHVLAIFPLSARLAYEGQHERNQIKLDESRFFELDRYLHLHLFNQYRDLQEKIRFNHRSQSLLTELHQFMSTNEGAERMGTIDITPTIQQARERYETQKKTIDSELKKGLSKNRFNSRNQRFHQSTAIKAELVNILTCTRDLIQSEESLSKADKHHLDILIEKIRNGKFRLGVFGSMKAGKSTFINTLLDCDELLPVDEERCTAAHTIVAFADAHNPVGSERIVWKTRRELLQELEESLQPFTEDPSFAIPTDEKTAVEWIEKQQSHWIEHLSQRDDWDLTENLLSKKQDALLLLEALPQYEKIQTDYTQPRGSLTQIMADKSAIRLVDHLVSYQDLPLLQHIDVIDSPGSGSTTLRDTSIARRLIKNSDALLFLSEAATAFQKQDEMRLLHHFRQEVQEDNLNKLFIVATKVDLSKRAPEEIAQKISERLAVPFKGQLTAARIYPVSCRTGLNFEHFTADLNRFLQEEKDRTYLVSTNTQVEGLLKGLIVSYGNELTKKEESLQQIQQKIRAFQKDAEKIQRMFNESIHLSYRDVVTRSKEKDEFTFQNTLERLHKQQVGKFKDDLVAQLNTREDTSPDGAKAVMASASIAYIKDIMGKTVLEIQNQIAAVIAKKNQLFIDQLDLAKEKLEKNYGVFQTDSRIDPSSYSFSDKDIGDFKTSRYDWRGGLVSATLYGLAASTWYWLPLAFGLAAPIAIAAGVGVLFGLASGFTTIVKDSPKLAEMAVKSLNEKIPLKEPKGKWKPLKQLFDDSLEKMVKALIDSRKELLNKVLNDIQQQLNSQLQEQQKTETEKRLLHANRQQVEKELKFLKDEQAAVGQRIEAVYSGR